MRREPDGRPEPEGLGREAIAPLDRKAVSEVLLAKWLLLSELQVEASPVEHSRSLADAVMALLGRHRLDPDNMRGALVAHRVFEVSYRTDAEREAATEALIETLVGLVPLGAHLPNRYGESVTIDLDEPEPEGDRPWTLARRPPEDNSTETT